MEINGFEDVDWFLEQYEIPDDVLVYTTPIAYIEFSNLQWETLPREVQEATLQFSVHTVTDTLRDDDGRILSPVSNNLNLAEEVFKKLMNDRGMLSDLPSFQNLAGTGNDLVLFNSINRIGQRFDHRLSNYLVTIQTFETRIFDYSATPDFQQIMATLNLSVNY